MENDSPISREPLKNLTLSTGFARSWRLSIKPDSMVFEGRPFTWHIAFGLLLSPILFWVGGHFGIQNREIKGWLAGMPLLYAGCLLIGRHMFQKSIPPLEIDRKKGIVRSQLGEVPLSCVRAVQIIQHLHEYPKGTRRGLEIITVDSEGMKHSRRLIPVMQLNLVFWEEDHFVRGNLANSDREDHILTDARAMADFIGVPLDESYMRWEELEPFYRSIRMVFWVWSGFLAAFCILAGIVGITNPPKTKESLLIVAGGVAGIITFHVASLIWLWRLEERSRKRAMERSSR